MIILTIIFAVLAIIFTLASTDLSHTENNRDKEGGFAVLFWFLTIFFFIGIFIV